MRYKTVLMALMPLCSISMHLSADEPQKELQQKIEQQREKRAQGGAQIPREELMHRRQEQGRPLAPGFQQGPSDQQRQVRNQLQNPANKSREMPREARPPQDAGTQQIERRTHDQSRQVPNQPLSPINKSKETPREVRSIQETGAQQVERRAYDRNVDANAKVGRQKGKNIWAKRISKEKLRPREERLNIRVGVVRNQFIQKKNKDHIFDRYFWEGFKRRHRDWFFDAGFNWSTEVSWPSLSGWLSWNSSRPIYYYYGEDGAVYYGKTQNPSYLFLVPSGADFIAQAVQIANRHYPLAFDAASWRPFGVFGLDQGDGSGELVEYITLAINQQGFLKGAYFNAATGDSLEIQGSVDPKSQRAAWKFVGQDWPVMESGFYNLTQDEATLFIYRNDSQRESRAMIRLN